MDGSVSEFHTIESWDVAVLESPTRALDRARALLADPGLTDARRSLLLYVVARCQQELGRAGEAVVAIREAASIVGTRSVDDDEIRRSVLTTAAGVLTEAGELDDALVHLSTLERECAGVMLGRVYLQQAFVLQHAGRSTDALAALERSDRLLAAGGNGGDRLRVHQNRGVILLQQGDLERAETDFLTAADLAARLGMTVTEGQCFANMGALYGRARRLLDALTAFARAAELLDAAGRPDRVTAWMEIDRAEVMMHSGLDDDAVVAARSALSTALPSGNAMLIGDALVMCARAELSAGLFRHADRTASIALEHLAASGRDDMVPHAESIAELALLRQVDADGFAEALARSAALADLLRASGWQQQGDELAVARILAAWRLGRLEAVGDDIDALRLHAWGDRRDLALVGWFAEAVGRRVARDPAASIEAAARGLDVLDEITAEAADLEERSAAMRLGNDLSRWIIEVAVDERRPDLVLAASEGTRARALHEELDGRARHRPLTEAGAERLRAELRSRLPGRCLVQWVVTADRVHAVVCDDAGNRLVDVADLRSVVRARDRVTVWLDLAAAEPDGSSVRAERAAALLDELLLAPLGLPADVAVVVVPVDELHGVPWAGLPTIAERSVVLSPSSRLWLDADRRSTSIARTVGFVSGPNLADADLERAALRRLIDRVDEATGAGATVASVRTMFAGHDLVHVAAHGRFRADRPLLSTFELADGDVTLHEVVPERVRARLAILSSCEGGAHRGTGGSEVLGLASVLLARGAASVLAPLSVVRDLECGEFVSEVHAEMAAGARFGTAVAAVRSRWLRDDDLSRWAVASSFACFGSGETRRAAP